MALLPKFPHGSYTVGWICALPVEMAAAKSMLDEMHMSLPVSEGDANVYTLGRIGDHNVAIAGMPNGVYGTTSAAIVASQMPSTFRNIRFVLMVGIGGGIPNPPVVDIRLGDIVVGTPTAGCGGVLQYDYGKARGPGHFELTGMLNQPPRVLLSAITSLRANNILHGGKVLQFLSDVSKKNPQMMPEFRHGKMLDVLFQADYRHVELEETCDKCDMNKVVNREPRSSNSPKVHYGLIASANQLMRDGLLRDHLREKYGALCVEMESAGLMNDFQCLVIRGICDYADSHKNNKWQSYAAVVAAAYTKELLEVIPAERTPSATIETALASSKLNPPPTSHIWTRPKTSDSPYGISWDSMDKYNPAMRRSRTLGLSTGGNKTLGPLNPEVQSNASTVVTTSVRGSCARVTPSRPLPCPPDCKCICHEMQSQSGSWKLWWLQRWIGRIYFTCSTSPSTTVCYPGCHNVGQRKVQIHYACPRWFWQASIQVLLTRPLLGNPSFGLVMRRRVEYWDKYSILRLVDEGDTETMERWLIQAKIFTDDLDPKYGGTALQRAIQRQSFDTIEFLLRQGADPDIPDELGTSARDEATFDFLKRNGNSVYRQECQCRLQSLITIASHFEDWGFSYLHKVVLKLCDTDLAAALQSLIVCSQLETQDRYGRTPLHWAVIRADERAVLLLVKENANVNACDEYGKTPLHFACENSSYAIFELLLHAGSCPTAQTLMKEQPIHKICKFQDNPMFLRKLLEFDVDINSQAVRSDGLTPVISAIDAGQDLILQELIDRGASLCISDQDGDTPLFEAVAIGSVTCLEILLQNQDLLDITHVNSRGMTVLHLAAIYPSLLTIWALEDAQLRGLDPKTKDKKGLTARERLPVDTSIHLREAFESMLQSISPIDVSSVKLDKGKGDEFFDCFEVQEICQRIK